MDPKTLHGLSRNYARDKNFVYYQTKKLAIEPKDFKNLKIWDQVNSAYISDGKKLYYCNSLLNAKPTLDADSFGMLPHSDFFYDKNGIYRRKWNEKKKDNCA